jgi:polyisoprenoid-binding protein YceI
MLFSVLALAAPAPGSTWSGTARPGKAQFLAVGKPALMKIRGEGATVAGAVQIQNELASGEFKLKLDEFNTGITLRDEHMKEKYLKTKEYPEAVLKIESMKLPAGFKPGQALTDQKFEGQLTLKGKTATVAGTFSIEGASMATKAKFPLDLSTYDVGVPSYMGITVAQSVEVEIEIPGFTQK